MNERPLPPRLTYFDVFLFDVRGKRRRSYTCNSRQPVAASLTNQSHRRVVRTSDHGQILDSEFVSLRLI